jgi:hypothetical protein
MSSPLDIDIVINTLAQAKIAGRLKAEFKKYTKPALLILDELGYLPIDKSGADLLFQVISLRYEQGSTMITSNRAFKDWAKIFNHDSTLTAAISDRLLHHAETVVIEGKSYRMDITTTLQASGLFKHAKGRFQLPALHLSAIRSLIRRGLIRRIRSLSCKPSCGP